MPYAPYALLLLERLDSIPQIVGSPDSGAERFEQGLGLRVPCM